MKKKPMDEKLVMDAAGIDRALTRIAHEILEANQGPEEMVLIGVRTGGVFLAQRLREKIQKIEEVEVPLGIIDITLYRDDLSGGGIEQPVLRSTQIPFPVDDKIVILVDDVLFTGRSARAAMDAIIDFGRPRMIQLAVMVDRGHRELPIQPDYVGKSIATAREERVGVLLREGGEEDRAIILSSENP